MKRWAVILTLLTFTFIQTIWRSPTKVSADLKNVPSAQPLQWAPTPLRPLAQVPSSLRRPASSQDSSIQFQQPVQNPHIERHPQSETEIKIGNSFAVLENVFALPKEKYQPTLGIKISEFKNLVFFRPSDLAHLPSGSTPVAMNTSSLKLYPVSQIIHLKEVDATLRAQLLSEGAKEYYYQSRLKVMSIEATENSVIQTYRDFLERGLKAKLEVLKDPPSVK